MNRSIKKKIAVFFWGGAIAIGRRLNQMESNNLRLTERILPPVLLITRSLSYCNVGHPPTCGQHELLMGSTSITHGY